VVLLNHGQADFPVKVGDRVAQLVVEQVDMSDCQEVEDLDATERGSGGFGSTGIEKREQEPPAKTQCVEASRKALKVKRLQPEALLPTRGSELAAGFDLAAAEAVVVPAGGKAIAKTGLSVAVPTGTYARIAPRSGLAAKRMIHCGAGVVDADYRGPVGVVLFNFGTEDFVVNPGDRVAQMILEEVAMVECKEVDSLDDTERGAGGFGSTGVAKKSGQELSSEQAVGSDANAPLLVKRLVPEAKLPLRGSTQAAGFDLSAVAATTVPAHGKAIVKTGLSIATPLGTYARIAPRSGLAAKHMLHCGAGVVDADYRGEVGVVLFNHGSAPFEVAAGDRIAQLILEKISMLDCVETDCLEDTSRGVGGFGSTGIASAPEATATKGYMAVDGSNDAPTVPAVGGGA
jgi:deoxyuridine 5'-triphosphate nucleotidohydrolase